MSVDPINLGTSSCDPSDMSMSWPSTNKLPCLYVGHVQHTAAKQDIQKHNEEGNKANQTMHNGKKSSNNNLICSSSLCVIYKVKQASCNIFSMTPCCFPYWICSVYELRGGICKSKGISLFGDRKLCPMVESIFRSVHSAEVVFLPVCGTLLLHPLGLSWG